MKDHVIFTFLLMLVFSVFLKGECKEDTVRTLTGTELIYKMCYEIESNTDTEVKVRFIVKLAASSRAANTPTPYYQLFWILGDGTYHRDSVNCENTLQDLNGDGYFQDTLYHTYTSQISHGAKIYGIGIYSDVDPPPIMTVLNENIFMRNFNNLDPIKRQRSQRINKPKISLIFDHEIKSETKTVGIIKYQTGSDTIYDGNIYLLYNEINGTLTTESPLTFRDAGIYWETHDGNITNVDKFRAIYYDHNSTNIPNYRNIQKWKLNGPLLPNESRYIFFEFDTNEIESEDINTFLQATVVFSAEPSPGTITPYKMKAKGNVVAAFDPNSVDFIKGCFSQKNPFELRVNFENTGNAETKAIEIDISFKEKFGIKTIEIIDTLPNNVNNIEFAFDRNNENNNDIKIQIARLYLPGYQQLQTDPNILASHQGHITLKITPSAGLEIETITAQAFIKFQGQAPIATNVEQISKCKKPRLDLRAGLNFPSGFGRMTYAGFPHNFHLGLIQTPSITPVKNWYPEWEFTASFLRFKDSDFSNQEYKILMTEIGFAARYHFNDWLGIGLGGQVSGARILSSGIDNFKILFGGFTDLNVGNIHRRLKLGLRINAYANLPFPERTEAQGVLFVPQIYLRYKF